MAKKKKFETIPSFADLIIPTLAALQRLGGSGTIEEINQMVVEVAKISEVQLQVMHGENDSRSEVSYRLAWARSYLKGEEFIKNSSRGVWALTDANLDISQINPNEIVKKQREKLKNRSSDPTNESTTLEVTDNTQLTVIPSSTNGIEEPMAEEDWKSKLLNTILHISPAAFERFAQRLLRESGFTQVEIIVRPNDGGIDGKGIVKISGFLSFHVIFQCKRYKSVISAEQIRGFRGALQGRSDKGLFITTNAFTREAVKEATRDGAPPIDLIDGELLCEKLKELSLGVETKIIEVEQVEIDGQWFEHL